MLKEAGFSVEFKQGDSVQTSDGRTYIFESYDADRRWCWCSDEDGGDHEFKVSDLTRA
jgi:hypothetical protein